MSIMSSKAARASTTSCSKDLFWLKEAPGKTLVVGAAYIALDGSWDGGGEGGTNVLAADSIKSRADDSAASCSRALKRGSTACKQNFTWY